MLVCGHGKTRLFIRLFIHAEATAVLSGQTQPPWPSVDLFLQVLQGSRLPFLKSNQFDGSYMQFKTLYRGRRYLQNQSRVSVCEKQQHVFTRKMHVFIISRA